MWLLSVGRVRGSASCCPEVVSRENAFDVHDDGIGSFAVERVRGLALEVSWSQSCGTDVCRSPAGRCCSFGYEASPEFLPVRVHGLVFDLRAISCFGARADVWQQECHCRFGESFEGCLDEALHASGDWSPSTTAYVGVVLLFSLLACLGKVTVWYEDDSTLDVRVLHLLALHVVGQL